MSCRSLVLALVALVSLLTAGARAAEIRDVRLANHEEFVRCVIELDRETAWRVENGTGTRQPLSVELAGVTNAPSRASRASELRWVGADRISQQAGSRALIQLDVDRPVRVESQTIENPWRLVLDIYESGPAASGSSVYVPKPAPVEVASANQAATQSPVVRLGEFKPRVIVLDPGHGGHHRGGIGKVNGKAIDEEMVTLPIAVKLERILKADPMFDPRLTRRSDVYVGLRERTRRAEQFQGNLFISIHYNAVPAGKGATSARGLEFWTWGVKQADSAAAKYLRQLDNEEDVSLGSAASRDAMPVLNQMMLDALEEQALDSVRLAEGLEAAFLRDSFFKKSYRGIKSSRFKVLENYNMPSVLVEVGFISHPEEAKLSVQDSFQQRVAQHIYDGIVAYYMANDPLFRAARMRSGRR